MRTQGLYALTDSWKPAIVPGLNLLGLGAEELGREAYASVGYMTIYTVKLWPDYVKFCSNSNVMRA